MRKGWIVFVLIAVLAVAAAGCGGSGEAVDEEPPGESPPATSSTPAEPADDAWTAVTTLRSSDPQELEGLLISEPFDVAGTVKLTLDMPDGGKLDGVTVVVIPAAKAKSPSSILKALPDAQTATLIPSMPTEEIPDLDGTYVLVNSVPTDKAWAIKIEARL